MSTKKENGKKKNEKFAALCNCTLCTPGKLSAVVVLLLGSLELELEWYVDGLGLLSDPCFELTDSKNHTKRQKLLQKLS